MVISLRFPTRCLPAALLLATTLALSAAESARVSRDDLDRIRDEGLNRSEVMATAQYLTDVIGPRLTGSPALRRANEWTRDRLVAWGLTNAQLHAWGPFGRGWTLDRFRAELVKPACIPLHAIPRAWSPGLSAPLRAEVLHFYPTNQAQLDAFKDRLAGAIVLTSEIIQIPEPAQPLSTRLTDSDLLDVANTSPGGRQIFAGAAFSGRRPAGPPAAGNPEAGPRRRPAATPPQDGESPRPDSAERPDEPVAPASPPVSSSKRLAFLAKENPALIVSASRRGDNGTLGVSAAAPLGGGFGRGAAAWSTNPPAMPPQMVLAAEQYNRLARMIQQGERLEMEVDLQVTFHDDDLQAYNTLAELPGSDLRDEIVMLGAHLDSWHGGTGATDNAAGVAAVMEAVRLIKAAGLQPRRTIRVALWSGEEQGLYGSRAYVRDQFGSFINVTLTAETPASDGQPAEATKREERRLAAKPEYDRFSAYFNLDNGAGKIRGVYLQSNEAVRPLFRSWLEPLRDLGATTLAAGNTGSTDHMPFDAIGLPGFQFIQDPLDYFSRTHHTSADVFERIPPDDLKQASVVLAMFAYQAAMQDEKLPRKANAPQRWP